MISKGSAWDQYNELQSNTIKTEGSKPFGLENLKKDKDNQDSIYNQVRGRLGLAENNKHQTVTGLTSPTQQANKVPSQAVKLQSKFDRAKAEKVPIKLTDQISDELEDFPVTFSQKKKNFIEMKRPSTGTVGGGIQYQGLKMRHLSKSGNRLDPHQDSHVKSVDI